MAYFPHAWQKMLVGTHASNVPFYDGDGTTGTNGTTTTLSLAAGQIGIVSNKNHVCADLDGTPTYATYPMIYLAQGSFHASDTLGSSLHGGYKETVKSKGINPKYVSKFYKTLPSPAINQVVTIDACGCTLPCNTTYWLKVEVKGSPALRFLTHNVYQNIDGFTGCCNSDEDPVDANVVLLQWADRINASPILNPFVSAKVMNEITALGAITGAATAAQAITVTERTGILAGDRVEFTSSGTSTATAWKIIGKTLTLTTVSANLPFSVGQVITDASGLLSADTKIVKRLSGAGGTGSTYLVNKHHNITVTSGNDLSGTGKIIAYVKANYTAATGAGAVALVIAETTTTKVISEVDIIAFTTTSVDVEVWHEIATATYVAETTDMDDICGKLELTSAYVDTAFGDCSFDPKDHYEIEPLSIYASIVDESGDPCNVYCFAVAEEQEAFQGKGYGETLIRELILAKEYQQESFHCDPRMREILDNTALTEIPRDAKYVVYHILHSVPRKSNPTGTMDSDQYLVKVVLTETGYANANTAKFETWMNALLTSALNDVQLEVLP